MENKNAEFILDDDVTVQEIVEAICVLKNLAIPLERQQQCAQALCDNGIFNVNQLKLIPSAMLSALGIPIDVSCAIEESIRSGSISPLQEAKMQIDSRQVSDFDICQLCNDPFAEGPQEMTEECFHIFCRSCIHQQITSDLSKGVSPLLCPRLGCSKRLSEGFLRYLVGIDVYSKYLEHLFSNYIASDEMTFRCPYESCDKVLSVDTQVDSNGNTQIFDANGKPLSQKALQHYIRCRIRCRFCCNDFCLTCKSKPYHSGYDCKGWKAYQQGKRCRFCQTALSSVESTGLDEICDSEECVERKSVCCGKTLSCGHFCCGTIDTPCLPCLRCDLNVADDYCAICYVESLEQAPCIQMEEPCNHLFHHHCVKNKIKAGYSGARITFGFKCCPLDNYPLHHQCIAEDLKQIDALEAKIADLAVQRLKHEGREREAVSKGKSLRAYALSIYLFFACFKCKKPYFAGGYQCQEAAAADFDPSDLICPSCQPKTDNVKNCRVHGTDWIAFKCRFCCQIANWFCWGQTHFCDNCHNPSTWQSLVEFRTGKNKKCVSQYSQCPSLSKEINRLKHLSLSPKELLQRVSKLMSNPADCPLGLRHPPNGIEFGIGCIMCADKADQSIQSVDYTARKDEFNILWKKAYKSSVKCSYKDEGKGGVFEWLGSFGGQIDWVNPGKLWMLNVSSSELSNESELASSVVSFAGGAICTVDVSGSFLRFDFQRGIKMQLRGYVLRAHPSLQVFPRSWEVQVSTDGKYWRSVHRHSNDMTLIECSGWSYWAFSESVTGNSVRIVVTLNSEMDSRLCIGGIEFYGILDLSHLKS